MGSSSTSPAMRNTGCYKLQQAATHLSGTDQAALPAGGSTTSRGQHYQHWAALSAWDSRGSTASRGQHCQQGAALLAGGSTTSRGQHYQ